MSYEVLRHSRDDDSYMSSCSSFTFHVCSQELGDQLATFCGSHDSDSSGSRRDGVQEVTLDGNVAVATHADGKVERVELPVGIALADGGEAIVLTWADGRTEKRARQEAIAFSKYGQPFALKKLVR